MARVRNLVLAALLIAGMGGCATNGPGARGAANAIAFPSRLGAFTRQGDTTLDLRGDPLATYHAGALAVLTVYYYRDKSSFPKEYANCKAAVRTVQSDARLISDKVSNLRPGGRRAVFEFRSEFLSGSEIKLKSELLLFTHHDRYLKFRATYPASHADRAEEEIANFVRNLSVP